MEAQHVLGPGWAVLWLLLFGLGALVVVGTPFLLIHEFAKWWFDTGPGARRLAAEYERTPTARACMGCEAPYYSDWDPPDFTPQRARRDRSWMSGGLCPNCSGAD